MDWFLLPPLRRYESKLQLQPLVSFLLFTVGYLSFWKHREKREGESSQTHREKLNRGETERQPKRTHGAKKEKDEDVRFQYRDKRSCISSGRKRGQYSRGYRTVLVSFGFASDVK